MVTPVEIVLQGAGGYLHPGPRILHIFLLIRPFIEELLQEAHGRLLASGPGGVLVMQAPLGLVVLVGVVERRMGAAVGSDVDVSSLLADRLPMCELVGLTALPREAEDLGTGVTLAGVANSVSITLAPCLSGQEYSFLDVDCPAPVGRKRHVAKKDRE